MTHFWTVLANLGTWLLQLAKDHGADVDMYEQGREDGYIEALSDRVE